MDLHKTTFQRETTSNHPLFKNLNRCIMTKLQERVLAKGICPECHRKDMSNGYSGGGMSLKHCKCGHTWVTVQKPNIALDTLDKSVQD